MNARQAKWIVEKLCQFILREQGRGFAMSFRSRFAPNEKIVADGIRRYPPSCGTVCCIGGSIEILKGKCLETVHEISRSVGLTEKQGCALFYGWEDEWPQRHRSRYAKARSMIAKAIVAVSLLKIVAKTRGKCLDVPSE